MKEPKNSIFKYKIEDCGAGATYQLRLQACNSDPSTSLKQQLASSRVYDFLSILLEEGKVKYVGPNELLIPEHEAACFTPAQLNSLNMPPRVPQSLYEFFCEASGTELRPNYRINYGFKDSHGLSVRAFKVQGAWVQIIDKLYTLSYVHYTSIHFMNRVNSNNHNNQKKLAYLTQLQKVLPARLFKKDGGVNKAHILVADKFTLDLIDAENFKYAPSFVEKIPADSHNQVEGDDKSEDEKMIDILTKNNNKKFKNQFLKRSRVQETYVLDNTFVVPSPRAHRLLQAVKSTLSKNFVERQAFFNNPEAFFAKAMGDEFNTTYEDVFVSTPLYQSQRISHIGEWQPKLHAFVPKSEGQNWFPEHCIGVELDEGIVRIPVDEISELTNKMKQSLNDEKNDFLYKNQSIKASPNNLKTLQNVQSDLEQMLNEADIKNLPLDKKEKRKKLVAIIKDNLEGEVYEDLVVKRNKQPINIPHLLNTAHLQGGQLYQHQREGLRWLQESWNQGRRGALLADDMGLGKTLQVLCFLSWLKNLEHDQHLGPSKPLFIVAPKSLILNWKKECNNFLLPPRLGHIVDGFGPWLNKMRKNNFQQLLDTFKQADVVISTYQSLAQNEDVFRNIGWRVIVFDECQAIKNPASFQTDMAKAMAAEFSIAITGTPVENRLSELWCIVDTIRPGFFGLYKNFKKQYEIDQTDESLKKLASKIKSYTPTPLMLRRMKADHLKGLPNKNEYIQAELMPECQQKHYEEIVEKVKNQHYKSPLEAIQHLKSVSLAPVLADSLRANEPSPGHQSAGVEELNSISTEGEDQYKFDTRFIHTSARLVALFKILDSIHSKQEKALIFVASRALQQDLLPIIKRRYNLPELPLLINGTMSAQLRQQKVDSFQNAPEGFSVMMLAPKAGGVGLTLTKANNVVHLERWWNPAVEDQCSDRVYRIGQTRDVNIYIPMAVRRPDELQMLQNLQRTQGKNNWPEIKKGHNYSFDTILHTLLSKKRTLSQNVIAPTTFTQEEHKQVFECATDQTYDKKADDFLNSPLWKALRYRVLSHYGHRCQKCGATRAQSPHVVLHVDHIKPRSKYPELRLDFDNLQVLCGDCNLGKSNRYEDDYRPRN